MKLTQLFHRPQLVSLLSESDTQLVFGLQDPETGKVQKLTITADMAVLPDEALLSYSYQVIEPLGPPATGLYDFSELKPVVAGEGLFN